MKYFSLIFLLCVAGCAHHEPWTTSDKLLLGTNLGLQTIDYLQTKEIARNPNYYEKLNLVLDEHPSQTEIDLYFAMSALGATATAYYLPPKWRNVFFGCWIGISGTCVIHNYQVGVRF